MDPNFVKLNNINLEFPKIIPIRQSWELLFSGRLLMPSQVGIRNSAIRRYFFKSYRLLLFLFLLFFLFFFIQWHLNRHCNLISLPLWINRIWICINWTPFFSFFCWKMGSRRTKIMIKTINNCKIRSVFAIKLKMLITWQSTRVLLHFQTPYSTFWLSHALFHRQDLPLKPVV